MTVIWTAEALEHLSEIEKFIGTDSPGIAEKLVNFLIERGGESIAHNPVIRELIVKKYRIVYRVQKNKIEILTVSEGHRLLGIDELEIES